MGSRHQSHIIICDVTTLDIYANTNSLPLMHVRILIVYVRVSLSEP